MGPDEQRESEGVVVVGNRVDVRRNLTDYELLDFDRNTHRASSTSQGLANRSLQDHDFALVSLSDIGVYPREL